MKRRLLLLLLPSILLSVALASDAKPPVPLELRAMSFNIRLGEANDGANHWKLRKELVFGVIRDHKPDVVGLQEAWKFQIDEILEALPEYALIGRSRQEDPEEGEWCPILYRKADWSPIDSGTFWLSDAPEKEGSMSWGNKIPRICTWGRFKHDESGRTFHLYNTHFDHQSQPSREKSSELCLKQIAERSPAEEAAIFMGDLNAGEKNPAIMTLNAVLTDTFEKLHSDVAANKRGTFGAWTGKTSGERIDYVFTTPGDWELLDARILHDNTDGRYPSDHYPVDARLKLLP